MSAETPEQALTPEQEEIAHLREEVEKLRAENKKLEELALMDALTETFNRRGLEKMAEALLPRDKDGSHEEKESVAESGHPITVGMFDLDNFKQFNTDHGHIEADEVLREAAKVLQRVIRGNDIIARYGGEEFLVIFTNTTDQDLKEKLLDKNEGRLRIGFTTKLSNGKDVSVTFSGGFTMVRPDETLKDFNTIANRADQALYESKKSGKDRITPFPEPEEVTAL
jgi:diguanylate cyclase (GGDEF)-like protein